MFPSLVPRSCERARADGPPLAHARGPTSTKLKQTLVAFIRHVFVFVAACGLASAEVTRVEILARSDIGASGYEKITGRLHFAVDPGDARNRVIADIELAPRNASGQVEFSSDLSILKPKVPAAGNGAALVEISNRGGRGLLGLFNRGGSRDPQTAAELGDGFLMQQGFTLVTVGWEFDVPRTPGLMRIEVPVATQGGKPITGLVRARLLTDTRVDQLRSTDLAAYPIFNAVDDRAELAILRWLTDPVRTVLPRSTWRLNDGAWTLDGGFDPGRNYEISYEAANPPIAGLGFAAIRDATAWLKQQPDAVAPVRHAYAFGSSQSGRWLRDFIYHGFNTDERDRAVFDGVISHIAGAARLNFNRRWSVPRELGLYTVAAFPFSDAAQIDPVSGVKDGLLENERVRHQPKIFYTNTSVEYWGGGRVAALVHTTPAGTADIPLPENVRCYAFAGTQHGPAAFPPKPHAVGQERANPLDFIWSVRALLPALHRWAKEGIAPPESAYPTFRDGTLVRAAEVAFPAIPGVASPRALTGGGRVANPLLRGAGEGALLPLLVSQVDADGNERGGIRLPDITVPLATSTGWNFRQPAAGAPETLVALQGSWIPFPPTRAAREKTGDPRRSIEERYASREDYLTRYQAAADAQVKLGYLRAEDLPKIMARAGQQWDLLMAPPTAR